MNETHTMNETDAPFVADSQSLLLSPRFTRHRRKGYPTKTRTKESMKASKETMAFLKSLDLSQIIKPDELAPSDLTSKVGNCSYDTTETATTVTNNSFEDEGSELSETEWRLPDLGFLEEEQDESVDDEQDSVEPYRATVQPRAIGDRQQDGHRLASRKKSSTTTTESWFTLRLERIKQRFLPFLSALARKESGAGLPPPSNKWTLRVYAPDEANRVRFQLHEQDKPATMTVFGEEILRAVSNIVENTKDAQFEVYSDTDKLGLHFWGPDMMVKLPEYVNQH